MPLRTSSTCLKAPNDPHGLRLAGRPAQQLSVVCIGGGTGLANLLKGLKKYVRAAGSTVPASEPAIAELSAIVTVTDDGGSSGILRKEFNVLPPGDIRNCITALAADDGLLQQVFQHRFRAGVGLNGHRFGNLFLTALTAVTGDFCEAVAQSSRILATCGHIYPSTKSDVQLEALMADGTCVLGETRINAASGRIVAIRLVPAEVEPLPQTLAAIANADLITIGPGSLFTSLAPNLVVRGISQAIAKSRAVKVFVCNLMTEANESLDLSASDHVRVLNRHAGFNNIFGHAAINRTAISIDARSRYAAAGEKQIDPEVKTLERLGIKVIVGDYLEESNGTVRHVSKLVAHDLLTLAIDRRNSASAPK